MLRAIVQRSTLAFAAAAFTGASAQQQVDVHMVTNTFRPDTLTVTAGTAVRFINDDSDVHMVSQRGGGFDSGLLFSRDTWTYVFDTPGTYEYFCLPHPYMVGTITVQ